MNLTLQDHGVDHTPAVVDHDELLDLQLHGLRIDLDDHGMHSAGGGPAVRPEVVCRLQTWFGTGFDGAAQRVGSGGKLAQCDGLLGVSLDTHLTSDKLKVVFSGVQLFSGRFQDLRPHVSGSLIDGIAGDDGPPAGKGPRAPVKLICVTGYDVHVRRRNTQLIGHDLGEAGEMALALGSNACGDGYLPVRVNLNTSSLVRPDAGSLDVGHDPDPDVLAILAALWLGCLDEVRVADHAHRRVHDRLVVPTVIDQRGEVLVDDLVVVRE